MDVHLQKKPWLLTIVVAVSLAFAFLPLAFLLQLLDSESSTKLVQHFYIGQLANLILEKLGVGEDVSNSIDYYSYKSSSKAAGSKYVAPNLTACHPSEADGRPGLIVFCCPPGFQTPAPAVDFQFPDPHSPKRVRRPAHLLDDDYIAKYSKALSIMKSLPYDDPRNFMRQANLHCLFCTGAYEQQNSHTPLSIHRTWLFFPWHRMLLYFHERIVGSLIGDDAFALPFWAWDLPQGMVMPDMYANQTSPFFHSVRDFSHFPPRTVDLNFRVPGKNLSREEQTETNLAFMYNQMVSGAKKTELFMGCSYKANEGYCDSPGTVESAPHNTVHTWVGSNLEPGREDMGKFYSAARDPIFYAHHTNIDRLWDVWRELHQYRLDIEDPDWLDSFFYFYDETLTLVRMKVRDVLDISKLGYSYEEVDRPWLNTRPRPSVPPKLARQILKSKEKELHLSSNNNNNININGRALEASLTVKVKRSNHGWIKKEKEEEEEEVLVVHGIEVRGDAYVKFDVYINMVDESIMSPKYREFAGTFAHIPGGVGDMMEKKSMNLKLGVSELLQDLEAAGDESIWVTLLPRTASCSNVTIQGIQVVYIK